MNGRVRPLIVKGISENVIYKIVSSNREFFDKDKLLRRIPSVLSPEELAAFVHVTKLIYKLLSAVGSLTVVVELNLTAFDL